MRLCTVPIKLVFFRSFLHKQAKKSAPVQYFLFHCFSRQDAQQYTHVRVALKVDLILFIAIATDIQHFLLEYPQQ
jgi:hypothetical protein